MKERTFQFTLLAFGLTAIGFRYFSSWCIGSNTPCYGSVFHQIFSPFTIPLYFFALYLLPLAVLLVFISRPTFRSWLKFAVWAIPLLAIWISTQPVSPQQILSTNRDDAARLSAIIFSVVSIVIIVWKYIALRRSAKLV